jgi:indole-3-glycerol phosphate synthase
MVELPNILAEIIAHKRAEVERRQAVTPLQELEYRVGYAPLSRNMPAALVRVAGGPVRVLAELKRRSPSAGLIRSEFHPVELAQRLQAAGADALSVLTDEKYFGGSFDLLAQVRQAVGLPVLCKDFIIHEYQVWEAKAWRADSFLLIADALNDGLLRNLLALGRDLGMEPLVEAHGEEALERALACGARLVGINNRDLRTFRVDLETTARLARLVPPDRTLVSESGISSAADVAKVLAAGAQAVLVGESLMRASDPAGLIQQFKSVR